MSGSRSSVPGVGEPALTEPVGLTVHSMPRVEDGLAERRTASGRLKMLLVLAICAAPVVASYLAYFGVRPMARNNYADLIQPTRSLPADLPLRTLEGQPVAARDLHRQWLLVSVATGVCNATCEAHLYMQRQVHQMLGKDRARMDKLWLVVDGAPPRPELLPALTQGPDPARVLRVPREAVARWLEPAPGAALEDHLYLVDPMGEWMMRVPAKPDPMRLKKDLDRLLRASASWDTAGR
jgi:hypothetical protein